MEDHGPHKQPVCVSKFSIPHGVKNCVCVIRRRIFFAEDQSGLAAGLSIHICLLLYTIHIAINK